MSIETSFISHLAKFNLSYATIEEFNFRKGLYTLVDTQIKTVNIEQNSYRLDHNKFSTWSPLEHQRMFAPKPVHTSDEVKQGPVPNAAPIDWRTSGAVGPVKDQGTCAADWAFSTTGVMEGAH